MRTVQRYEPPSSCPEKFEIKACRPVLHSKQVLSEDDSDAESRDSDYEIIEEMKKANQQRRKGLDEIRIPETCPVRVAPARKESDRHMAARAQSLRNRAILENLKADLEAETPEPGEGKGAPVLLACIYNIGMSYPGRFGKGGS